MTTTPMGAATIRGLLGAVCTFGVTALSTQQVVGNWEDGLVAGGVAGLTYVLTRIVGEGAYDTKRDQPPAEIQAGDVGRRP